jgi:hypothetical protein
VDVSAPRVTASDLSRHASASTTSACHSRNGVTSGCPYTDNNGGEFVVPWAVFAEERVSTNDASDSWEAVARTSEPPVAGAPAGRLTTSEATISSSIGLTHAGGPVLAHSSNSAGQARGSSAQQQRCRRCRCGRQARPRWCPLPAYSDTTSVVIGFRQHPASPEKSVVASLHPSPKTS